MPEQRSLSDYVLQPTFYLFTTLFSLTVLRAFSAIYILLPSYILVQLASVLPTVLRRLPNMLIPSGRTALVNEADGYRSKEEQLSDQQLNGTYRFQPSQLSRTSPAAVQKLAQWSPNIEELEVCGATVRVIHEAPTPDLATGQVILLLHGNPSWSYMYRHLIPLLLSKGHEVLALDWLGHGLSDKPLEASTISFALHQRILLEVFAHYTLFTRPTTILAHDWGGCIAACTAPLLAPHALHDRSEEHKESDNFHVRPRMVFLNTFLPPRPGDISWNCLALYWCWFFSTGILGGWTPEGVVMRVMSPFGTTGASVRGFEAPFSALAVSGKGQGDVKASVGRFSHAVPALPDLFYTHIRPSWYFRLLEGLVGPQRFTNVTAQTALFHMNTRVRQYWVNEAAASGWRVGIIFGREDPLLRDFKGVLEKTVQMEALVSMPSTGWVSGAGHYPLEERAEEVGGSVERFLEKT